MLMMPSGTWTHGTVGGSSWPAQTATVAGAEAGALPVASEVGAAAATAAEEAMAAEAAMTVGAMAAHPHAVAAMVAEVVMAAAVAADMDLDPGSHPGASTAMSMATLPRTAGSPGA